MKNKDLRIGTSDKAWESNWIAMGFIIPMHILGLVAWPTYLAMGGDIHWVEVSLFFFMAAVGVIGIDMGYHRGFSHRAFKMSFPIKLWNLLAASSTAEASAIVWCADHRRHHRYEDTPRDPYNVNKSFWWAHMGWMFGTKTTQDFSNCPDLLRDPLVKNQHDYYVLWMILTCFGFPVLVGSFFGRGFEALLLAGFTRLMLVNQFTYLINSWAHYFGTQPYSRKITARDSAWLAIFTGGEGYHNYHHRFPFDYRNGIRWYQYDPTKWTIMFCHWLGLVKDLKQAPATEIYRARIQAQLEKLEEKRPSWREHQKIQEIHASLEAALERWNQLNLEWTQKRKAWGKRRDEQVLQLKARAKEAQEEFKQRYAEWLDTLKRPLPSTA